MIRLSPVFRIPIVLFASAAALSCSGSDDGTSSPQVASGAYTCPDGVDCASGEYCVSTASGVDGGGSSGYACETPGAGCTPAGECSDCQGSLPESSCQAQLCFPSTPSRVTGGGRVVDCMGM